MFDNQHWIIKFIFFLHISIKLNKYILWNHIIWWSTKFQCSDEAKIKLPTNLNTAYISQLLKNLTKLYVHGIFFFFLGKPWNIHENKLVHINTGSHKQSEHACMKRNSNSSYQCEINNEFISECQCVESIYRLEKECTERQSIKRHLCGVKIT